MVVTSLQSKAKLRDEKKVKFDFGNKGGRRKGRGRSCEN